MKIIDMHPDDLLDRELSGTLALPEQRRLEEHLGQCAGCRLERQLRDDFSRELSSLRAPDVLQTFVSGALRAALPANNGTTPIAMQTPLPLPRPRRSSRRRAALLATALVIASGAAAAHAGLVSDVADFARDQVAKLMGDSKAPPARAAASERTPKAASNAVPARTAPAEEADAAEELAPVVSTPPAASEPEARVPEARVTRVSKAARAKPRASRSAHRARRENVARTSSSAVAAPALTADVATPSRADVAQASVSAPSVSAPSVSAPSAALLEQPGPVLTSELAAASVTEARPAVVAEDTAIMTASSLFHRANSARHEGRGGEAMRLYQLLRSEFPTSAEARLSLALAARMQLDSGRLGDAVAGFDAYLATRDRALREQAIAGRALALGRLERTRDELSAWRDLLRDYPDSSYATLAAQRLRQDER
jgi:hypothetical protein